MGQIRWNRRIRAPASGIDRMPSTSKTRVPWTCPRCKARYAVPSTQGLTLCPKCQKDAEWSEESQALPAIEASSGSKKALLALVALGAVVLVAAGVLWPRGHDKPDPLAVALKGSDKAAVEKWLKENLPDGKWEEIRWWPSIEETGHVDRQIADARQRMAANEKQLAETKAELEDANKNQRSRTNAQQLEFVKFLEDRISSYEKFTIDRLNEIKELEKIPPRRICGIKLRAKSSFGALSVDSLLFEITDGIAAPINSNDHTAWSNLEKAND